ncbi:HNH endonuclease [Chitinophaga sp.]|uniref:HNH endonuclease n=1 Tax=Chitinophaga sp. TaxID=1869181 RepID=UPI0031CEC6B5
MKNPNWRRDELILALALYFSSDRGPIDKRNPKIIALSNLLRNIPFNFNVAEPDKYRNPDGVAYKLLNIAWHDPNYVGGMPNGSKLDKAIFNEFIDDQITLKEIATEIIKIITKPELRAEVATIEDDEEIQSDSVKEGSVLYKWHKSIERNRKITERKKKQAVRLFGRLACEVCAFDFSHTYGPIGEGFIECHHRIPLALIKVERETKLEDLALVCSNCHRMLHRRPEVLTIDYLKKMLTNASRNDISK